MKRILCMLLALCMVLSFMPRTAAAQADVSTFTASPAAEDLHYTAEEGAKLPLMPAKIPAPGDHARSASIQGNQPYAASPTIHYWISEEEFGDTADGDNEVGVRYYFNYEITDSVSGRPWDDVSNDNYNLTVGIYYADGTEKFSHDFSDDSGWISTVFWEPGTYYFGIEITGDLSGTVGFNFSIANTPIRIETDASNLSLAVGSSRTVNAWPVGYHNLETVLYCSKSNDNIDLEWLEWDDLKAPLKITAKSAGTTTVTLGVKVESTEQILDTVTFNVTVTGGNSRYTVSFSAPGGTGAPSPISVSPGSTITIPAAVPVSNTFGNAFGYWDGSSLGTYYPGDRITVNSNINFEAHWYAPSELEIYDLYGSDTIRTISTTINFANETVYFWFNPGASSTQPITYRFEGSCGLDNLVFLYDANGREIAQDDDDGDGYRQFRLDHTFQDNNLYYLMVRFYDTNVGEMAFDISCLTEATCNHTFGSWTVTTQPTCTEPGVETRTCTLCGYPETREVPALGHDYQGGECSRCHEPDPNAPALDGVIRLAGSNRYATGFAIANQLKELMGVSQFQAVVIAYGLNFPDALTGSYLASVKNAPILLTDPSVDTEVLEYLKYNLASGGDVYILGGEAAVSRTFEVAANAMGFNVERLKGSGRYETNLAILREAGINSEDEILIATGKNYADSLSASATGLPMLLVDKTLTDSQREFLRGTSGRFVILGGTGAVSAEVEAELNRIGTAIRVRGSNRYLTSVLIANRYFSGAQAAVLAYAQGFPDGLCGGPLAMCLGAPLILTSNDNPDAADGYIRDISCGAVTGGTGRISDDTVREIFDLPYNTPIPKQ